MSEQERRWKRGEGEPGSLQECCACARLYPFDIACLLMRFFGSMLNIGVVTMITLSGYFFSRQGCPPRSLRCPSSW